VGKKSGRRGANDWPKPVDREVRRSTAAP
jgi:hypothetical protein